MGQYKMICCEKCFKDEEIKTRIRSLKVRGNCSVCGSHNVFIYNTDVDDLLKDSFNELLDIFTLIDDLPDYPEERTAVLKDELYNNWDIFNVTPDKIHIIIKNICKDRYDENPRFFKYPVGILDMVDEDILKENSILQNHTWEEFVQAITTKTRFNIKYINMEILSQYFSQMKLTLKAGDIFYRARICDESVGEIGYSSDKMGAPPCGTASGGRANPEGISYLYLSNKPKVTLYEIRAGIYDYVTIAEFKLKQDIQVVDFNAIDKISPFREEIDFVNYRINRDNLKKISYEISKPLGSSNRNMLDYLPTQYICDFIKSLDIYKGIKYESTLYRQGNSFNIAIFEPELFEFVDKHVENIKKLDYPDIE